MIIWYFFVPEIKCKWLEFLTFGFGGEIPSLLFSDSDFEDVLAKEAFPLVCKNKR